MIVLKKPLFSLHIFGFVFTPGLIPSLIFVILLPILIQLALWQWHRGEYKEGLERAFQEQTQRIKDFDPTKPIAEYTRLRLTGYYDNQHSFLLDNSFSNHRVGFEVYTPFIILSKDSQQASLEVLIDRGWVPRHRAYTDLPQIIPVKGIQTIVGRSRSFPTKSFVLGENAPGSSWPRVIESLKQSELETLLQKPLYSSTILLSPKEAHGFERQWEPKLGMPAQRHFAYAIQWLALALSLVIIYISLNTQRKRNGKP